MTDSKTCHNVSTESGKFTCSNCCATWRVHRYGEPTLWLNGVAYYPHYCQICGMEIKEPGDDR